MYEIAEFELMVPGNNVVNVKKGSNKKYDTFRELVRQFESCEKGTKFDRYFARGALEPYHRNDRNLARSNVFVIDGDDSIGSDGAPDIGTIRDACNTIGCEWFLYTTHSHREGRNKYRVLIPLSDYITREALKPLAVNFVKKLNELDCPLQYVKEMGTWSQPWFMPTRDDPNDGLFEWHYGEGTPLVIDAYLGKISVEEQKEAESFEAKSFDEHIKDIEKGHYHNAIMALSYGKAKDGVTKGQNLAEMRLFMKMAPDQDERWKSRYDDLERTVDGAYSRLDDEEVEDYGLTHVESKNSELPWPPGLMGELADLALTQAMYKHKEAALVSAVGLVAGISGRKFNVASGRGLGLNVYMMLTTESGIGKESITNFIRDNIPIPSGGDKNSFIGPDDFTGPSGLVKNHLHDARCMVSVLGEMGYILKSKSGDQAGKRRVFLKLYTASGHLDVLGGVAFSNSDNSIPDINSPSFSCIGESTPGPLIESLVADDSIKDGWLPRFSVFRITDIDETGSDTYAPASERIRNRIDDLIEVCAKIQSQSTFECHMLTMYDVAEMDAHRIWWRKKQVELSQTDSVKSTMASRLHVKALKYAGLATVFNKQKDTLDCLTIDKECWEWGKAMAMYEWNSMANFFQGAFTGSPLDGAVSRVFGKYMLLAVTGDKSQKKIYSSMDPGMMKDKCITVSVLRQVTQGQFSSFNNSFKDGFDIVMEYGISQGYFSRRKDYKNTYSARAKDVLQIHQSFYDKLKLERV